MEDTQPSWEHANALTPKSRWKPTPAATAVTDAVPHCLGDDAEWTRSDEARARRVARKAGCVIHKSRSRPMPYSSNKGGFMLLNGTTGFLIAGEYFDLSPDDVIRLCADLG